MSSIPINTGTGPQISVDTVGTSNFQIVKVMQAPDGSTAGLTSAFVVIGSASPTHWNALAINTTSGASVIVKTSGANTLYITSLLVSVDHSCRMDIFSAATTQLSVYLASNGGFALPVCVESPLILNSNQSLTFTPSVSGSASCWAAGFTVT